MEVPFSVLIVNSATKNNVTYYLLQIQQDEDEEMSYAVDRRFTDFVELDEKLRNIFGQYIMDQLPQLPKKTFMRQSSDSFVKKRHYYLQQFLNGIHEIPFLVQSKTYRNFLKMDSFFPSSIPIRPFLRFVQNKSQHGIRLSIFNMIMLSHNVFISIAGCHPEIAFCDPEKIQSIQTRINQQSVNSINDNKKKDKLHSYGKGKKSANKFLGTFDSTNSALTSSSQYSNVTRSPSSPMNNHHHHSPIMGISPSSPLTGRIGNDLTNAPSSSMLPSPNEWGGCIQIWYYDTSAMNPSSGQFSWWLEERGDDNKNFYGWNKSTNSPKAKKSLYEDEYSKEHTMDHFSYYGGADDLPIPQHQLNSKDNDSQNPNLDKKNKKTKRKRMKEINRELDCIFLNEVPTSMHYDRQHQQLFVGTLMGNIHRFKIIHNQKIEATGILPNPNIYNNVSNIHSYCHSSIYTYIHHQLFAKEHDYLLQQQSKSDDDKTNIIRRSIENKQRIHQRLYEQRELLKLKERQIHHKKAKRKMALIPDNDAIYNKAILNMVSYGGILYISDACSNIHAFDINEFKHLHYLSLDHYFVDILQTEYKIHVDEYYKKRMAQYRAQHQRMMFKSNEPKDIHTDPIDPHRNKNSLDDSYDDDHAINYKYYDNDVLNQDDNDDDVGGGGLFSKAFLKNRNKSDGIDDDDDDDDNNNNEFGIDKKHDNALSVSMRIGGVEADTAYEMYFDELVFSTTITKQKEKILNVTNKLNQDIIVTDLIKFEDTLFIPTNLPYLTLQNMRYPKEFNVVRPKISVNAVLETKIKNDAIIVDEKKDKEQQDEQEKNNNKFNNNLNYSNPYKKDEWEVIPNKQDKEGIGCDNIFGTVSNFDCHNDVLYSIPTIHTIHKDFLIYDDERIRASAHRTDNTNDMSVYNQCTIFVWAFTTHISVDLNNNNNIEYDNEENEESQQIKYADYESWYDNKQRTKKSSKKKGRKKRKKANTIKDRTWHLKAKWYDKTVEHICKEFSSLTYCQSIRTLAVGGISGYIALFNSVGTCFNIFFAHTDTITKLIWLDDSKQLVSTGLDGCIKIWNLYHAKYINLDNTIKNVLNDDNIQENNVVVDINIDQNDNNNDNEEKVIDDNDINNNRESPSPAIIKPQPTQSNVQYLNTKNTKTDKDEYEPYPFQHEPEPERFDDLPDLAIDEDDDDLTDLYKSKTDNVNVDDYDPFGQNAFDEYLDKREQNLKQREALYYRPQKTQKRIVSSKQLLATQSVLKQENSQESISTSTPPPNKPKSKNQSKGFRTMKVNKQKVRTSSPRISDHNNNEEEDMGIDDIEKYISQQYSQQNTQQQQQQEPEPESTPIIPDKTDNFLNKSLNSSMPFASDNNSPDPGTPIDFVAEHDSSPEPQRNSSFHVLKKQKPKKKRKKRKDRDKDREDSKDKKDKKDKKEKKKKDKKKKKKKDKQRNAIAMEPEDCTIRYENDQNTYSAKIATAFSSGAAMIRNKYNEKTTTNPFDALEQNNSTSTNPFDTMDNNDNNDNNTNPFGATTNNTNVTKQKSTNPFFADGDLP